MKFYITTAIDYVNAKPHVGHAYEKIIADVIARWHRLKGEEVFFLTGTDENAQKNEQAAKAVGAPTNEFVDENTKLFVDLCQKLNISNDYFVRTTEERHFKVSQEIFKKLLDKGDIYKGAYEGYYCVGCESYITEKELVKGKCPEHDKEPEWIKQESYFFKMSKYESQIKKLLQTKDFVVPDGKRKEMLNRLESEGLKDLCVSRLNAEWGVPVPGDEKHMQYVWLDALLNYVSALDYPDGENFKKFWPADVQVIGKGINWFHSVIWPSILLAADVAPPKTILVHGYLTVDGKKISKSLGTTIDPMPLVGKYGADAFRYFMMREIPLTDDGDFSEKALVTRLNNELANDLGNLLSRTISMVEKYFDGVVPEGKNELQQDVTKIEKALEVYELHNALSEVWKFVNEVNKYINDKKPWEAEDKATILYTALDSLRIISILVSPFMPETSARINEQLGMQAGKWQDTKPNGLKAGIKVKKGEILFQKVE